MVAPGARCRSCSDVWSSSGTRTPAARSSRRTGRAGGRATVGGLPATRSGECRAGEGAQVRLAERPLAGAHGHGRVALEQLRRAIALVPGLLELPDLDVLAQADEALAGGRRQRTLRGGASRTAIVARARPPRSARLRLVERAARPHDVARVPHAVVSRLPQQAVARLEAEREDQRVARDRPSAPRPSRPPRRARRRVPSAATTDAVVQHLDAGGDPRRERARRDDGHTARVGTRRRLRAQRVEVVQPFGVRRDDDDARGRA